MHGMSQEGAQLHILTDVYKVIKSLIVPSRVLLDVRRKHGCHVMFVARSLIVLRSSKGTSGLIQVC